jgi:hypothetical protein
MVDFGELYPVMATPETEAQLTCDFDVQCATVEQDNEQD